MSRFRIFTAERDAYRFCAAIDKLLGFPQASTETYAYPQLLSDGRYAVHVDEAIDALEGRSVDVDDGGRVGVTISTVGAVEFYDLAGATQKPIRGGLTGSPDGRPIPEAV